MKIYFPKGNSSLFYILIANLQKITCKLFINMRLLENDRKNKKEDANELLELLTI